MKIVVLIPAHNERDSIVPAARAALRQWRRPDRVVVLANNCSDDTAERARSVEGVIVHESHGPHGKAGALNDGWRRFCQDADLVVCIDADTILPENALRDWAADMVANPGVGGISAKFTMLVKHGMTPWERLLVRLQRAEFAKWTDTSLRRGHTSVLAGTACCIRNTALREAAAYSPTPDGPWWYGSLVEDFELTYRIRKMGWVCKVSESVRAYTDAMTTLRALWAQRMKWQTGTVRDLLASGLNDYTRRDWWQQAQGLLAAGVRVLWVAFTLAAGAMGRLEFAPIWFLPTLLFVANDVKQSLRIPHANRGDVLVAALLLPQELFAWMRAAWFAASWLEVLRGKRKDRWSIQSQMELTRRNNHTIGQSQAA